MCVGDIVTQLFPTKNLLSLLNSGLPVRLLTWWQWFGSRRSPPQSVIARPPPCIKRPGNDDAARRLLNVKVHVLVPTWEGVGESMHGLSDVGSNSTSINIVGFGRSRGAGSLSGYCQINIKIQVMIQEKINL